MPNFSEADPIHLLNSANQQVVTLSAHIQPVISLTDNQTNQKIVLNGANGNYLGGGDTDGDLVLLPANVQQDSGNAVIHLDAGGKRLLMRSGPSNLTTVRVEGAEANLWLGGNGFDGDIVLHPSTVSNDATPAASSIHMSADGSFIALRSGGQPTIVVDGQKGDIVFANADGAEEFEIEDDAEPGSVLVIGDEARLRVADRPYDRRVAGIVSGADGIRPGIVLGRSSDGHRVPVALFGKVNCRVDASFGSVGAGDLLTTSATRGYAMRAEPGGLAPGAVIGKALRALAAGRGLVPVLVSLQ